MALRKVMQSESLTRAEAFALLNAMLDDSTQDVEIAAVLTALAQKGETADELTGMSEAMRDRMVRLRCDSSKVIDTAGTGASKAKTFNVSTAASFVIAAAGLPIAKHGARAATSSSGSADVLRALGCDVQSTPAESERLLSEHSICFLFAPQYHPAAARVAPIRRQLGFRTVFNLIGPLSSPSRAKFQLIGVSEESLLPKMAQALANLGCERGFVVHGEDGLDEVSLAGSTRVAEVHEGKYSTHSVQPEIFGVERSSCEHLRVADAQASAEVTRKVLAGNADRRATDLVVLNAAAALIIGLSVDARTAAEMARKAITSGAAMQKLEALRSAAKESNS